MTAGIVSALQRPVTTGDSAEESSYINAVQTDAAINPGNSGGPLVNMLGQVIGVNSAIATTGGTTGGDQAGNIGVGFAIPIEQVKVTADQILRTGEARYPVIGAKVQTGQRDGSGAEIDEVIEDTPAEDAGLEKGDVVVALEGQKVTDGIALIVSIRSHQPGETLTFTVVRDGDEKDIDVTLDSEVGWTVYPRELRPPIRGDCSLRSRAPGSLRSLRRCRRGSEADRGRLASLGKTGSLRSHRSHALRPNPRSSALRGDWSLRSRAPGSPRSLRRCRRGSEADRGRLASLAKTGSLRSHRSHCASYPRELRPHPRRLLAALAGAWLAALASALSPRLGGRSRGASLRSERPGRFAPTAPIALHTPASFGPNPRDCSLRSRAPGSLRSLRRCRRGSEADRGAPRFARRPSRSPAPIALHTPAGSARIARPLPLRARSGLPPCPRPRETRSGRRGARR